MQDLKQLSLAVLIDMLDKHTNEFLKMFKTGASKEEYDGCKRMIAHLTAEIESRKQEKSNIQDSYPGEHIAENRTD